MTLIYRYLINEFKLNIFLLFLIRITENVKLKREIIVFEITKACEIMVWLGFE